MKEKQNDKEKEKINNNSTNCNNKIDLTKGIRFQKIKIFLDFNNVIFPLSISSRYLRVQKEKI